ncbi:hypothetical protein JCM21900_004779 [Sporobolomyces salmonicolor]
MRSVALFTLAVSSLALFASASPEPCDGHSQHRTATVAKSTGIAKVTKTKSTAAKLKVASSSTKTDAKKAKAFPKEASMKTTAWKKVASTKTSSSSHASKSSASSSVAPAAWTKGAETIKKKAVPKVKNATKKTVTTGAEQVIGQFANSSYIPAPVASSLTNAVSSAINKQLSGSTTVTLTKTSDLVSTATHMATKTSTIANSTVYVAEPTTVVHTVTQNVTEVATSTLITTSSAVEASLDIQKAIDEAFAAANLSQNGLDSSTTEALEACLTTVLASGGLPDGYACLTSSGSDSAGLQSTLNTILEQFVGILPNTILSSVFDAVTPLLSSLLPASEQALVAQIQSSIQSVTASLSGNSVTALEQVSSCYTEAVQQAGNTSSLACFTKEGGAVSTLQTATNSVLEQFVGVLPASLTTAVENILTYNLANTTSSGSEQLAAQVSAQISNAINSVSSSLAGNTVTLAETLQACAAQLIATGNATAAQQCITSTTAPQITTTTILSIAQQFDGYLPSSFFTDLVNYSTPLLQNYTLNAHNLTQAELNADLEAFFNNKNEYGAAYVTCMSEVEKCVTNAIVKNGTIDAVCGGPVDGCTLAKADSKRFAKRSVDHHFGFAGRIRTVKW